jgi:predicted transcriptional regulator
MRYPGLVPTRLNVRTDADLERALGAFAKANDLTRSQATRELLRQVLQVAEPVTRGWLEGFAAGHAEAQRAYHEAAAAIPLPAPQAAEPGLVAQWPAPSGR